MKYFRDQSSMTLFLKALVTPTLCITFLTDLPLVTKYCTKTVNVFHAGSSITHIWFQVILSSFCTWVLRRTAFTFLMYGLEKYKITASDTITSICEWLSHISFPRLRGCYCYVRFVTESHQGYSAYWVSMVRTETCLCLTTQSGVFWSLQYLVCLIFIEINKNASHDTTTRWQ